MGRKRDRKQASMGLGAGGSSRRVKLDLWTPDPALEAHKSREAASKAAQPAATGAGEREVGAPPGVNELAVQGGFKPPGTAASGLGHLLGSYEEDSEEGEGLTEDGAPVREAAKGEDLDDKVKDFLAELETDGLLQEGVDGAAANTLADSSAEDEQSAKQTSAGPDAEEPAVSGERAGSEEGPSRQEKQLEKDEEEEVFAEAGWQAVLDPSSGEQYYWNTMSRETTWEKPRTAERRNAGEARPARDKIGNQDSLLGTPAAEEAGAVASAARLQAVQTESGAAPSSEELASKEDGEEGLKGGPKDLSSKRAPHLERKGSADRARSARCEPSREGPLTVEAGSGAAGQAIEEGGTDMEAAPKVLQASSRPEPGGSRDGSGASGRLEGTDEGVRTDATAGGQATAQAAGREEAAVGSQEEAGPGMKEQLVVVQEENQAAALDTIQYTGSSEHRALVDSVLEGGEALVERLHNRAGMYLSGVTPLARLAIQAEALTDLAWKLQGQDSMRVVWAKIREQLLQLSAHVAEAEHAVSVRAQDTPVEASERGNRAGPAQQGQSEADIEALLEDVDLGKTEGPRSRENGGAVSHLFPIALDTTVEPQHVASGAWLPDDAPIKVVSSEPQVRSAGDLAPSKAELLRRKTAALQQRMAAIQAFSAPAQEPSTEGATLSGLAGYGSSDDEIEEGEFVASEELANSILPSSRDPPAQHSVPEGEPMQIEPPSADPAAYPPSEATAEISYEAGVSPVDYQHPSHEYESMTTAPPPPEASYDPFADLQPPLPSSPPPADTWQAQPAPPLEETLPNQSAPVSSTQIEAPPELSEPPKAAQGPVLSAPPVRIARPVDAVPPVEQSRAAAAAAAAAAAKRVKVKKAAAPVGLGLSSAKKVSSLLDKWKAATQDSTERPSTPEEVERKKAQELEEWRRQQIVSGQADMNANFAPIEGDWRKRVEKAKKQAEKQARRSRAASADSPEVKVGKPDLAALAEGLPPGWKPFLDPSSGEVYYGNLKTSETTWERPGGS